MAQLTLSDLQPDELLAFVGLCKLMVRADKDLSNMEMQTLQRIGDQVGAAWEPTINLAKMSITSRDYVWDMAKAVTRKEVQALMHGELAMIAFSDALVPAETQLLGELSTLWEL